MKIIYLIFIAIISLLEAKVTVCAHYFGQPEFIKYQYLFFKKNLLDEHELIIFEDSNDFKISEQIQKECEKYDIKYVHIPYSVFEKPNLPITDSGINVTSPSFQCSVATQYIYDNYVIPSEDICLILDNDIFLLSPFSIEKHLGTYSFSYVRQEKGQPNQLISYMLPNFVIFNPLMMPEKEQFDFNLGSILGARTDSGGYTYFYLQDYAFLGQEVATYYLCETPSDLKIRFDDRYPLLFHSTEWGSHYFMAQDTFLHLRMGSNWSRHPKYAQMRKELDCFFQELLRGDLQ